LFPSHDPGAVGYEALKNCTTGDGNVAIGKNCLSACTTGRINVMVGADGMSALTTGYFNTGIGYECGNQITAGAQNVFLGFYAGRNQGDFSNRLWIARDSVSYGNAAVWIYGDNHGRCYMGSNDSSWHTTSDIRLKKNITDSTKGLAEINQLRVTNFEYRSEDEIDMSQFPKADDPCQVVIGKGKEGEVQTGVIAQEVESVLPECITESDKGAKTVNNDPITWALVKAVQELSAKNDALEARIKTLEG